MRRQTQASLSGFGGVATLGSPRPPPERTEEARRAEAESAERLRSAAAAAKFALLVELQQSQLGVQTRAAVFVLCGVMGACLGVCSLLSCVSVELGGSKPEGVLESTSWGGGWLGPPPPTFRL